jgi:hypothetical protein
MSRMEIARPLKCSVRVEQIDDVLLLRRRTGSFGTGLFLSLWLTGWTVGCVFLAGMVARQPTLEHILFAVPFWSSWVLVVCLLARCFFGVECLRIAADGLEFRSRALVTLWRRCVPLEEIKGVAEFSRITDSESGTTTHGLKIVTLGRPVRFGLGVESMERLWLADLLRSHLSRLVPGFAVSSLAKDAVQIEVLDPGVVPAEPSDCSIRILTDWDGTTFARRRAFSIVALGGITFLNLFWNGVVGIFVLQLYKEFQWFLFFFLIPFEAIGLGMMAVWFATLTAPFWVETWAIGPVEIVRRFSVFGLGRSCRVEVSDLGRVELRTNARSRKRLLRQGHEDEDDTPFTLGFVGREGGDLLAIDDLTEGEARWVGGRVCELLKGSLPKAGKSAPGPLWDREFDR